MKKCLKWIICFVSLIIFIILSILVLTKNDIYLDSVVYNFISKYITPNLTIVVKHLTNLGGAVIVITITLFILLFYKRKKYSFYILLNLILITIFQVILKNIFTRNRPIDINLIEKSGYSFPSGHTLTAVAFYGFIIYLICISNIKKNLKILYTVVLSIIIIVIGLSRVYLGVHFFTDVVGALTFSLAYLIIYTSIISKKLSKD